MRLSHSLAGIALAGALVLTGCDTVAPAGSSPDVPAEAMNGAVIPGRYIVVLKDAPGEGSRAAVSRMVAQLGVEDAVLYQNALSGFAGTLNAAEVSALRANDRVAYVEPDRVMTLKKPGNPGGGGGGGAQSVPYGIARVNGGVASNGRACVIDSGIDLDHPDLNVDVASSRSFLGGNQSTNPDDQNGHGTHVAGTIGAVDNSEGVVGVAAGATVVSIRVLDRRGSGSYSGVIAGVDHVASGATGCTVANMSLGGPVSQALDAAVLAAGQAGVVMVLAAGNESDDANNHSPARAGGASANDNVYAISAINSSDVFASFSNYGAGVAYAAPGVGVLSTWKSGGYNTISGTSMASPHAAGVFLLGNARTSGTAINDPDGTPDPIIVH